MIAKKIPRFLKHRPGGINFFEYTEQVLTTLFSSDRRKRAQFIFNLYDVDGDGQISALDLMTWNQNISKDSALGLELKIINDQVLFNQIMVPKVLDN